MEMGLLILPPFLYVCVCGGGGGGGGVSGNKITDRVTVVFL